MKINPLINSNEIQNLNKKHLVIVNAGSGDAAYENFLSDHLEGALYVDLNNDLAEIPKNAKNGGRHPLPSLEKFAEVLQRLGIDENSHVLIYDDKNAANSAARFWWMLKAAGIEKVQVLNGGFPNQTTFPHAKFFSEKLTIPHLKSLSREERLPVATGESLISEGAASTKIVEKIQLKEWKLPTVDLNFIEENSENNDFIILDVREKDRYDGKAEPIDELAGHIPGAINIPFKENLNEDGTFKSPKILRKKYSEILGKIPSEKIAIHCGSGVTACHTLLALDYAGFKLPNLYVGSWSEWSRNEKKIAKNI